MAGASFDNDNKSDALIIDRGSNSILLLMKYNVKFSAFYNAFNARTINVGIWIATGDLNNDVSRDIVMANPGTDSVGILLGYGNGTFRSQITYLLTKDSSPLTITLGDFNNDSRLNLVVYNANDNNVDIFLGNGSEHFIVPFDRSTGPGSKPHSVAVDDFDHDNRSDIVVTNNDIDNIAIILATEIDNGRASINYSTGVDSRPHALIVGHFNNDQKLNLVIANAGANNVLTLFGLGNRTFGKEKSYSFAVGDFDHDGWMDMAVGNFGADYVEILLQPC